MDFYLAKLNENKIIKKPLFDKFKIDKSKRNKTIY